MRRKFTLQYAENSIALRFPYNVDGVFFLAIYLLKGRKKFVRFPWPQVSSASQFVTLRSFSTSSRVTRENRTIVLGKRKRFSTHSLPSSSSEGSSPREDCTIVRKNRDTFIVVRTVPRSRCASNTRCFLWKKNSKML